MLEQQAERCRRLAMPSEHEATRGIAIEAMRQNGRARQTEAQRIERGFQIGSTFGTAMHRQPGRLVDHQHQPVAMKHPREDLVGGQFRNIGAVWPGLLVTFAHDAKRLTHPHHERHS